MSKSSVVLAVAVFAVAAYAPAKEFPLQLQKMDATEAFACPGGNMIGTVLVAKKPKSIRNEPRAVSKHPLYGTLNLGSKAVAFRLDETKGKGKGYDQLIVDLNANGNLKDDPVGKASNLQAGRSPEQATFGPVDASSGVKSGPWQPRFYAQSMIYNRSAITASGNNYIGFLQLKAGAYLKTTVDVGGEKQELAIADANCNMMLGDPAKVTVRKSGSRELWSVGWGDAVLRDRDGSGKFDGNDAEYLSSVVFFGPNPYTLALNEDRSAVRISPYDGPTGQLAVKQTKSIKSMVLGWQSAPGKWAILTPQPADGKAKVPVGTYSLYSCEVSGKSDDGATVKGSGSKREPSGRIKVAAGETATLACGAPLELRVQANKRSTGSSGGILGALSGSVSTPSRIDINVELAGAGGEKYSLSGFSKVDKRGRQTRPQPPRFKVLDESGKEVATGQLEYG